MKKPPKGGFLYSRVASRGNAKLAQNSHFKVSCPGFPGQWPIPSKRPVFRKFVQNEGDFMRHETARTGTVRLEDSQNHRNGGGESTSGDPRRRLCDTKYFSLRPEPLVRYLYSLNLPRSAERVFWVHWDAGNRNGNICSELPIARVARECCLDTSSVTRAYQLLKGRGLLRRQDPGRDRNNPFAQATAITEVLLPREALAELLGAPSRQSRNTSQAVVEVPPALTSGEALPAATPVTSLPAAAPAAIADVPPPPPQKGDMKRALRALGKLTPDEHARYESYRKGDIAVMNWEEGSALTPEERELLTQSVLRVRYAEAHRAPASASPSPPPSQPAAPRAPRVLNAFCLAYLRKKLTETAPLLEVPERLREIAWSVEEGALAKLEVRLALNVALKKLREGQWSRPNRMPPNWQLGTRA